MKLCYLCGKEIAKNEESGDHVVPRVLLPNAHPRAKGIDYGGKISTHGDCNHHFFPENYLDAAMQILRITRDPDMSAKIVHPEDPSIQMMAIDQTQMAGLSHRDLSFFGLADAPTGIGTPEEVKKGVKRDLAGHALQTIFSVLTKCSVALAVKRRGMTLPKRWHVRAVPFDIYPEDVEELRSQFQVGRPFGASTAINVEERDHFYEVTFFQATMLVYLMIHKGEPGEEAAFTGSVGKDADLWTFDGDSLLELKNAPWKKIPRQVEAVSRNAPCPCGGGLRYKYCHGRIVA